MVTLLLISGCAATGAGASSKTLTDKGFQEIFLKTDDFVIYSVYRIKDSGAPLVVYIEGDGLAWKNRRTLSSDPTPRHKLVQALAALDDAPNIAYLARPCQYVPRREPRAGEWSEKHYDPVYWSSKRFSEEVIHSMDQALTLLAGLRRSEKIYLVGYSGGGAVAVLVAARRNDIAGIRTIAGNLDPNYVNDYHHVSPLTGSLDPMDVAEKIKNIPQRHYIGSKDKVVPQRAIWNFVDKSASDNVRADVIEGCTHDSGWEKEWPGLLEDWRKNEN